MNPPTTIPTRTTSPARGARPNADRLLQAMRAPETLQPQSFGRWVIERHAITEAAAACRDIGGPTLTVLRYYTMATLHCRGEVVMEDSREELRKHLPFVLSAFGHVLVNGLGLGCVVRGLLATPDVESIDVVEIDPEIIRRIGATLDDPRVRLHLGDALTHRWPDTCRWDFAWHDVHQLHEREGAPCLDVIHARLIRQFYGRARFQGAWGFRKTPVRQLFDAIPLIGGKRRTGIYRRARLALGAAR